MSQDLFKAISIPCKGEPLRGGSHRHDREYLTKVVNHCMDNHFKHLTGYEIKCCEEYLDFTTSHDATRTVLSLAAQYGGEL